MHKTIRILLVFFILFGIFLANSPDQVQAKKIESKPKIAEGSWTAGTTVDISSLLASAPTWLQLLSTDGVEMTTAGQLCHPLRGGQFGWIGEIRQYKDGEWVKLETTNDWVPTTEGEFMACANAPAAGTYALFGYWIRPANYHETAAIDCASLKWNVSVSITLFTGSVSGVPANTKVVMSVDPSTTPSGLSITGATETYTKDDAGNFSLETNLSTKPTILVAVFTLPDYGCSYKKSFPY